MALLNQTPVGPGFSLNGGSKLQRQQSLAITLPLATPSPTWRL